MRAAGRRKVQPRPTPPANMTGCARWESDGANLGAIGKGLGAGEPLMSKMRYRGRLAATESSVSSSWSPLVPASASGPAKAAARWPCLARLPSAPGSFRPGRYWSRQSSVPLAAHGPPSRQPLVCWRWLTVGQYGPGPESQRRPSLPTVASFSRAKGQCPPPAVA